MSLTMQKQLEQARKLSLEILELPNDIKVVFSNGFDERMWPDLTPFIECCEQWCEVMTDDVKNVLQLGGLEPYKGQDSIAEDAVAFALTNTINVFSKFMRSEEVQKLKTKPKRSQIAFKDFEWESMSPEEKKRVTMEIFERFEQREREYLESRIRSVNRTRPEVDSEWLEPFREFTQLVDKLDLDLLELCSNSLAELQCIQKAIHKRVTREFNAAIRFVVQHWSQRFHAPTDERHALVSHERTQQTNNDSTNLDPPHKKSSKKLKICDRMWMELKDMPSAAHWTAQEWAKYLGCAKSTIIGSESWKKLADARAIRDAQNDLNRSDRHHGQKPGQN